MHLSIPEKFAHNPLTLAYPPGTFPEIVYGLAPLIVCSLPVRPPEPGRTCWKRQYGSLELRIDADPRYGVPFGEDRMILFLLATRTLAQPSGEVELGTAFEILRAFGLPPDGRNYARLAGRFQRVLGITVHIRSTREVDGTAQTVCRSYRFHQGARLWFSARDHGPADPLGGYANSITPTPEFREELRTRSVPADLHVIKSLLYSPGNLDFYMWLVLRSSRIRAGFSHRQPLAGPQGLQEVLGCPNYRKRDFLRMLRLWLQRISELWQDCPAVLSPDREHLLVWRPAATV